MDQSIVVKPKRFCQLRDKTYSQIMAALYQKTPISKIALDFNLPMSLIIEIDQLLQRN